MKKTKLARFVQKILTLCRLDNVANQKTLKNNIMATEAQAALLKYKIEAMSADQFVEMQIIRSMSSNNSEENHG